MKNLLNKILKPFGAEIHGSGYINKLKNKEFVKDAYTIQTNLLNSGKKTIFDVGANRGDVTMKYNELFPQSNIYSFEPIPFVFEELIENTKEMENVHRVQVALSDTNGKSDFHVNANRDTSSLLPSLKTSTSVDVQTKTQEVISVETKTIDQFVAENKIKEIDILKFDIQGGELKALTGAKNSLSNVKLIYTEFFFNPTYEDQPLFHDISALLHKEGFYLYDLFNIFYFKDKIAWGDAIFLNEKFFSK